MRQLQEVPWSVVCDQFLRELQLRQKKYPRTAGRARQVLALTDDCNVKQATLVGHDRGGQPALALAAERLERVSRLMVMNSPPIWDEQTSWEITPLGKLV